MNWASGMPFHPAERCSSPHAAPSCHSKLGVVVHPEVDHVAFQREFELKVDRATNIEQLVAVWHWVRPFRSPPTSGLMSLAKRLAEARDLRRSACWVER
jgi:hypothetical protein